MSERVKQKVVAQRLGLTSRQVRNLEEKGLPAKGTGSAKAYVWDQVLTWYVQFKQEEALERVGPTTPATMAETELRQAVAAADIAELKLANLRGTVVPLELHRKELRRVLGPVRAALVGFPGRFASQVIGLGDMPSAVHRLRAIAGEILEELQQAAGAQADAPEDGAEDDSETEAA